MKELNTNAGMWLETDIKGDELKALNAGMTISKCYRGSFIKFSGLLTSEDAKKLTPLQILHIVGNGDYSFMSKLVINDDYSFSGTYFID